MSSPDLLWHSAGPWDTSGYGQQSALVVDRLRAAGLEIELSAPCATDRPRHGGVRCHLAPNLSGGELARNVHTAFGRPNGNAVAFIDFVRLSVGDLHDVDLLYWFPFNFDPPPPAAIAFLRSRQPLVAGLSLWGCRALEAAGIEAAYVPCAIDSHVFRIPAARTRAEMRADAGIPDDAFVVGVVAVNNEWESNRKSLPEALMAFARFHERHQDARLFLHTDVAGRRHGGFDLIAVVDALGIPEGAVIATSAEKYDVGIRASDMGRLYSMFDVLLAPSAGEGFGLPVVEAQACGVPVITSDFSAQPELVGSGWTVPGQRRWSHYASSWLFTPDVGAIIESLESAYRERRFPCERAARHAAQFEIDTVVPTGWMPLIDRWLNR